MLETTLHIKVIRASVRSRLRSRSHESDVASSDFDDVISPPRLGVTAITLRHQTLSAITPSDVTNNLSVTSDTSDLPASSDVISEPSATSDGIIDHFVMLDVTTYHSANRYLTSDVTQ